MKILFLTLAILLSTLIMGQDANDLYTLRKQSKKMIKIDLYSPPFESLTNDTVIVLTVKKDAAQSLRLDIVNKSRSKSKEQFFLAVLGPEGYIHELPVAEITCNKKGRRGTSVTVDGALDSENLRFRKGEKTVYYKLVIVS